MLEALKNHDTMKRPAYGLELNYETFLSEVHKMDKAYQIPRIENPDLGQIISKTLTEALCEILEIKENDLWQFKGKLLHEPAGGIDLGGKIYLKNDTNQPDLILIYSLKYNLFREEITTEVWSEGNLKLQKFKPVFTPEVQRGFTLFNHLK